jgi:predicted DNA repair protein MutK
MVGGAFLCYEGFEKLAHKMLHSKAEDDAHHAKHLKALTTPAVDMVALEKDKIKGAVRTDFILSAEIIAITLGTVADAPFSQQVMVLAGIAAIMTVGVYGLVAGIVKLDDLGLYLSRKASALARKTGAAILTAAPYMMKGLSILGTAAMFMVGGGILTHGIPPVHHFIEELAHAAGSVPGIGGVLAAVTPTLLSAVAGILAGAIVLAGVTIIGRLFKKTRAQA